MSPPGDVRRGRRRAATAGSLALALVGAGVAFPLGAAADPAPSAADLRFDLGDGVSGTVPDGVCAVEATVVGGAGGRSAAGAGGVGANGAGAAITATFEVVPGTTFSGAVGGGGGQDRGAGAGGLGGANGGGAGGTAEDQHGGAGGGGFSVLYLGGTGESDIAVLAGGGGGSGGGHSTTTDGFGGDAGIPTGTGAFAGADGTAGRDAPGVTPGGGQGGGTDGPGAGGTSDSSVPADLDGQPGDGRVGGDGAYDPNYDAGGGGGGGWFGGGGGASTEIKNTDVVGGVGIEGVAGAGGGGGSSLVRADAQDVDAEPQGRATGTGAGADGYIELDWVMCDYDVAVTKSVSVDPAGVAADVAPVGSTLTWTVTVTNDGPGPMTRGDVVTVRDTLPGDSATTITSITTTGGSSDTFERGAVTCDAELGDAMPGTLVCSRPYALLGRTSDGVRGLDPGESLEVVYTQPVTGADGTVLRNTASVVDRVTGDDNDAAAAEVAVAGPPSATDDEDLDNALGEAVTLAVLGNDTVDHGPAAVELLDGDGDPTTTLVVEGEGTWTLDGGELTFTPEPGFLTDPTPVTYRVTDAHDLTDTATVTVTYLPEADDDASLGHAIGAAVAVDVLDNDRGDWDVPTLRLLDGTTPVTELVVAGEGRWTVAGGTVTFTPLAGFEVDPEPVAYQVTDTTGDTVTATVRVGYVPEAVDDEDLRNTIGDAVTVDVLTNDVGSMDASTVVLVDGADRVTELVVDGEGTWTVDPVTGAVTFTPEAGYAGNPAPVVYEVTDVTGDTSRATVTVTYLPVADDDADTGNTIGEPVTVDVLPNDAGGLDPATVRLVHPGTGALVTTLVVAGEGTWTVDTDAGTVTFTPEEGFLGNPTPVGYEVVSTAGDPVRAEVVVTYLPVASDDLDEDNEPGTPVTVDVVGNDLGVFDPTSVVLVDPATGDEVTTLVVDGEGTWAVDPETGAITFTPQDGFDGDPTPVTYRVTDLAGVLSEALVTITYLEPVAAPAPEPEPTPEPEPSPEPADDLAVTGWQAGGIAALAVALLLLGGAAIAVARRREVR